MRVSQITASGSTNLVFVHGLGGHWYNTWSKNGVFWPRDLLSKDVQNVRIITFGYDSDVVRFFGRVSQNQIRDHARTLITDLRRRRKKGNEVRCHETNKLPRDHLYLTAFPEYTPYHIYRPQSRGSHSERCQYSVPGVSLDPDSLPHRLLSLQSRQPKINRGME